MRFSHSFAFSRLYEGEWQSRKLMAHFFQEGRLYGAGGEYERAGGLSQHSLQHETRGGLQQGPTQVSQTSKTSNHGSVSFLERNQATVKRP